MEVKDEMLRQLTGWVVLVRWTDPTTHSGWQDEPLTLHADDARTVGWLVGMNDRQELMIAQDRDGEIYGTVSCIPTSNILSVSGVAHF